MATPKGLAHTLAVVSVVTCWVIKRLVSVNMGGPVIGTGLRRDEFAVGAVDHVEKTVLAPA